MGLDVRDGLVGEEWHEGREQREDAFYNPYAMTYAMNETDRVVEGRS